MKQAGAETTAAPHPRHARRAGILVVSGHRSTAVPVATYREGVVMKYYFLALGTLLLVCVGCSLDGAHILDNGAEKGVYTAPPAERLYRPGPMVDGPGPGVMPMLAQPQAGPTMVLSDTQVRFVGPAGMQIGWQIPGG